ncbi:MAG: Dihydrolipoyllysine-residue succinyltransferase component of 2-oxoglutarate dehydrogenase complex [Chlamydiia bacterium]|nr:Dihydrolipoyllysine-residue succinyltransferase component of 2-oxoglutarate dehydrogenase complex [Chlamydiia bacterium]
MTVEITVPPVGESITEATISVIMKQSGESVAKDEEILELETDKVNQVVHAPESGVLTLSVSVDDVVQIGQVIGSVDPSGAPSAKNPKKAEKPAEKAKKEPSAPKAAPAASAAPKASVRVSEDEYLSSVGKTPPQAAAPAQPKPKAPVHDGQKRQRMSGLRRTIAQRLVEVKNTTAMLTTFNEVDLSKVMAIRSKQKEDFEKKHGVKLGFLSFFVTACSSALKTFPDVNAYIDGDEIVYNEGHHIGIAVSTEKGLMVPVLKSCEERSFADIESGVMGFAKKARDGKIGIDDLQGGTFTITNGGVFGSLLSTPILNPPQSAILGMHAIKKRAVVVDDQIVIRPMMYLALSYDHRIVDGKEAVSFLVHLKDCLEEPSKMLLES